MNSNEFQWISLNSIEFQWISLDFNELHLPALPANRVQDSPFLSTHSLAPYSGERWPLTTHFTGSTAQISSNSSNSDGKAKAKARQGSGFFKFFKFWWPGKGKGKARLRILRILPISDGKAKAKARQDSEFFKFFEFWWPGKGKGEAGLLANEQRQAQNWVLCSFEQILHNHLSTMPLWVGSAYSFGYYRLGKKYPLIN